MTSDHQALDFEAEMPILTSGNIHLNHAGISPMTQRASVAMNRYVDEVSIHIATAHARWFVQVDKIRSLAANLIGAPSRHDICFSKSTTHGLLLVAQSIRWNKGDVIVVEETTFPANWYAWKALEEQYGVQVITWPEKNYRYEMEDLERLLRDHAVRLVSVSAADYATGFRHDLNAVGERVKGAGALYCIDGIQAVGAVPVDVEAAGADFLSADGHKWMLGPEGCGILYVRRERMLELSDAFAGWIGRKDFMNFEARELPVETTARRFEEGALNLAGILALGGSLALLNDAGTDLLWKRLSENCEALASGMNALGWKQVSPRDRDHSSGILAFGHDSINPDDLFKGLLEHKIMANTRRGFLRLAPHFYQPIDQMHDVLEKVRFVQQKLS